LRTAAAARPGEITSGKPIEVARQPQRDAGTGVDERAAMARSRIARRAAATVDDGMTSFGDDGQSGDRL
jgi:hypothetical protein